MDSEIRILVSICTYIPANSNIQDKSTHFACAALHPRASYPSTIMVGCRERLIGDLVCPHGFHLSLQVPVCP